jgi:hypothetical protein
MSWILRYFACTFNKEYDMTHEFLYVCGAAVAEQLQFARHLYFLEHLYNVTVLEIIEVL